MTQYLLSDDASWLVLLIAFFIVAVLPGLVIAGVCLLDRRRAT